MQGDALETKAIIMTGLFGLLFLFVLAARPYRCPSSNIMYLLYNFLGLLNAFMAYLRESGLRSALLVDTYFTYLMILINALGLVVVIVCVGLFIGLKYKWPINHMSMSKLMMGYERTLSMIEKSRKLVGEWVAGLWE